MTKFLVYNARKRQPGGDQAATYFERTECVAGVQDARFQQLMPDVLHWLGITRIDRFVSMSNMKYDALVAGGIEIGERVPIPASWSRRTPASRWRRRRPPAISRRKARRAPRSCAPWSAATSGNSERAMRTSIQPNRDAARLL